MGAKLMSQYNITQAELIERSDDKEKALLAGESVVEVVPTAGGNGKVRNNGFTDDLAHAMHVFFDCKSYSVARAYSIEWVFYGVASNTAAAAMAFEMAYNLTLGWALEKKGPSVKHSYTMGVSAGLLQTARIEKKEELRKAEEAEAKALVQRSAEERAQRQKEIERLDLQVNALLWGIFFHANHLSRFRNPNRKKRRRRRRRSRQSKLQQGVLLLKTIMKQTLARMPNPTPTLNPTMTLERKLISWKMMKWISTPS